MSVDVSEMAAGAPVALEESADEMLPDGRRDNAPPAPGPGRPKGMPNKLTTAMRNTAQYIAEDRADAFIGWLNRVAETKPAQACNIYIRLLETYSPKPQAGFAFEAGTRTNERGESVIALQLRSLLEAPVETP